MAHDRFSDTPKQDPPQAASSMTADDDQVGRPLSGGLVYDVSRVADADEVRRGRWKNHVLTKRRDDRLIVPLGQLEQFLGGNPNFARVGHRRFNHEQRCYFRVQRLGEFRANPRGVERNRAAIDRDQDSSKSHVLPPLALALCPCS